MDEIKIVTDYLDRAALNYPNKIGFVDDCVDVTYSDFRNRAMSIASVIIDCCLNKVPIAIYLSKSTNALISAFGIMYSNCFYTFLDTEMPMARVKKITDILQPKLIITDSEHSETLRELNIPFKNIDEISDFKIDKKGIDKCRAEAINTDIAYVLFTSGSTGVPKGVVISHLNIITYMNWSKKAFGFDENTVFGNQTPFYFSMSVLDIFQTFNCAGRIVIIPKKLFSFPVELLEFINCKGINTIYWVPSALCHVANMGALESTPLPKLKTVLFAGEVMPTKQLNIWRKYLPDALYADLFGPTEVTDICTYYILDRHIPDSESIPIGYSCDNMDILIINDEGNVAKQGQIGELYVRGASVSYGYYNNPQKTAESFIQNPVNKLYPEIVYKTGDLVYENDRGEIIYVSRKDFQIKHMGYRIELGEIEAAVSSVDGIKRNCCVYDFDNSLIVLFYTGDVEQSSLKKRIKALLPKYMIPNVFRKIEDMPLNLNGKIDRKLLTDLIKKDDV